MAGRRLIRTGAALRASIVLLAFTLATQLSIRLRGSSVSPPLRHSLFLPSGEYLRYVSLGHETLLADQLYIWSIQYYAELRSDRWRNLYRMYDVLTDLDPRFVTAYVTGALILALEADRFEEAIELLDKGMRRNPDRYVLPFEAAFYSLDIGQSARAAEYLRIAKNRPDAPSFVARWHAHVARDVLGDTEALTLWREAGESAASEQELRLVMRHVRALEIRIELTRLGAVVSRFESGEGRRPRSLAELVARGYLVEIPRDDRGNAFLYDAGTGQLSPPVTDDLFGRYR